MLITSGNNLCAENLGTHSPIILYHFFLVNVNYYFVVFKQQTYPQPVDNFVDNFVVLKQLPLRQRKCKSEV